MSMFKTSLISVLIAIFVPFTAIADSLQRLNVSYSPMPLNAPSIVANKLDIVDKAFKSEGIDVKYHTFLAGPQMTEAFAARSLDIASVMGATSAIVARSAGVDIRIIAAYGLSPKSFAIVVPYGSDIKTIADLRSKTVGGPKGTAAHQLLGKALQKSKMALNDVNFQNMLVPDVASAVVAKQIDAGILVEPHLTKLVDSKKVKVIRDGVGLIGGLTVITARGDLVSENKNLLKRYLKAHQQAVRFLDTNPVQTLAAVTEETKLTKDQAKRLLESYDFNPMLRPEVIEEIEECIDFMFSIGMTKKKISLEDIVVRDLL